MPTEKLLSDDDVAAVVEAEGLGYAVQHYMSADRIANPKLRGLWKRAADALDAIDKILETDDAD